MSNGFLIFLMAFLFLFLGYLGVPVAFAIGVDVLCELANEGWLKWQQAVYDVIVEAYQRQKAAYDEQQRVAAITQTNPVKGDNPLSNVRTVRDELKKWVLMLMIGKTDIGLDGFLKSSKPVLDLSDAIWNERIKPAHRAGKEIALA